MDDGSGSHQPSNEPANLLAGSAPLEDERPSNRFGACYAACTPERVAGRPIKAADKPAVDACGCHLGGVQWRRSLVEFAEVGRLRHIAMSAR